MKATKRFSVFKIIILTVLSTAGGYLVQYVGGNAGFIVGLLASFIIGVVVFPILMKKGFLHLDVEWIIWVVVSFLLFLLFDFLSSLLSDLNGENAFLQIGIVAYGCGLGKYSSFPFVVKLYEAYFIVVYFATELLSITFRFVRKQEKQMNDSSDQA